MRAKEILTTIMEQPTAFDVQTKEIKWISVEDRLPDDSEEKISCNCQHNSNSRDDEPCCRCDSRQTNADRIRNMSDEELAELITGSLNFDCADYCDSFTQGCAFDCNKKDREMALKWLQSEAE